MIIETGGDIAEVIINSTAKSADELVRLLLAHGVTAAKIIKPKPATGEPAINFAHDGDLIT